MDFNQKALDIAIFNDTRPLSKTIDLRIPYTAIFPDRDQNVQRAFNLQIARYPIEFKLNPKDSLMNINGVVSSCKKT